jgi:crotonobetainyl-CoA:carnitine CoA-transferase CaiB-like acyl-CoA transferase
MALEDVRVLDLATAMAGPYAATLLADLGAAVIKVEKPRRGDLTRFSDRDVRGESSYFLGINRGKEGMTVDLRTAAGQELVRRLVATVDVVIENYRPGMMDSWGLGYEDLAPLRPGLVYCSVSAYGGAAGYERAIGNDMTCQAYSGLMDMTGDPNGSPQRVGAPVVDTGAAMQAALGIVAALYRRQSTGEGEHVKVSLIEAAFSMMPNYVASVANSDTEFHRVGLGHPRFAPYEGFECADGNWLVMGTFHNRSWEGLCRALGREDLLTDDRYLENWDRTSNKESLHKIVGAELAKHDRDHWVRLLQELDVPCGPVLSVREAVLRYGELRPGFLTQLEHTELGQIAVQASAITFEKRPLARVGRPAATLGEDNDRLLSEIGCSAEEIGQLRADGVI